MKNIIVTGTAGFIGAAVVKKLLERGDKVYGIDNENDYYDISLKKDRLKQFVDSKNYTHIVGDISNFSKVNKLFDMAQPWGVINLAAQAGVRYSIENPKAYIDSNLVGFHNILEAAKEKNVKHLVYASSSSVYGSNTKIPFSIHDNVDHPLSLYAATKKSNELTAHAYSNIFQIPTTGLRFFTVYGPWGRPDMALFKFTKDIINGNKIKVFNYGNHLRDFTYIDDIVEGVIRVLDSPAKSNNLWDGENPDPGTSTAPWRVYNIGNNNPVNLGEFIETIEKNLGIEADKELLPLQLGDVPNTYADVDDLVSEFDYKPSTSIQDGVEKFIKWYKEYYGDKTKWKKIILILQ